MKAPSPPDPYKTAAAQTASNQGTAISQQLLNMTNQVTPYGTLNYDQTGTRTYYDASLKRDVTLPSYTATTSFTPEQQALFDQGQQFDSKFNDIALQQTDKIGNILNTPFNYDPTQHDAWATGLYDKLNGDRVSQQQNQLEQKLANQGLQPGTAAYDDAARNLSYSQDKARNDFQLGSYNQGFQTALTNRNQPLNEITALMSGQQVQQPQFASTPTTGVNGTDIAGLINNNYNQKMQNYQSQMGGMMGLGSTVLGGLFALSDKRTKTNIKKVGKWGDLDLHSYEYKEKYGGKKGLMHLGVIAQEAEKTHPEAVVTRSDGLKMVDYGRIAQELAG